MSGAHVFIDRSQFPESVRHDLLASLRARAMNPKFHYDSHKQAAKWLALHEAFSPARRDASALRTYDEAFQALAARTESKSVSVVGLGCGGGQKEARLLELLGGKKRSLTYTPCDVSLPLVLAAQETAQAFVPPERIHPIVCDLATTEGLNAALNQIDGGAPRLVTLFGIIPNFEPAPLLRRVAALLRPDDLFLFSANLAPGPDYTAGVRAVLPQYDNASTHDWLMTLLLDLGFENCDGTLRFAIETDADQLQRIVAHYELSRARTLRVYGEALSFEAGERLRIFFSYRHTSQTLRRLLRAQHFELDGEWLNDAREEGVFLGRKSCA